MKIFDIRRSSKSYIDSREHFIVAYQSTVYLRVVGHEGNYRVMTATASEDDGSFWAFKSQELLNEAARNVSRQLGVDSISKYDFHNRPYVEMCSCQYLSDVYRASALLFTNLNEAEATNVQRV